MSIIGKYAGLAIALALSVSAPSLSHHGASHDAHTAETVLGP